MTRPVYRIVALCLALIWGPVTMCCGLESLGLSDACCPAGACHDVSSDADSGFCSLAEEGNYVSAEPEDMVAAPTTLLFGPWVAVAYVTQSVKSPPAPGYDPGKRPRDWVPIWQFERRAAAPAHAPDSIA